MVVTGVPHPHAIIRPASHTLLRLACGRFCVGSSLAVLVVPTGLERLCNCAGKQKEAKHTPNQYLSYSARDVRRLRHSHIDSFAKSGPPHSLCGASS
eukprot:9361158-Pyramimonas_sp.AAC.1